ncbi:hypothetical protein QQ045_026530 [Rhodiola kirilowii]
MSSLRDLPVSASISDSLPQQFSYRLMFTGLARCSNLRVSVWLFGFAVVSVEISLLDMRYLPVFIAKVTDAILDALRCPFSPLCSRWVRIDPFSLPQILARLLLYCIELMQITKKMQSCLVAVKYQKDANRL